MAFPVLFVLVRAYPWHGRVKISVDICRQHRHIRIGRDTYIHMYACAFINPRANDPGHDQAPKFGGLLKSRVGLGRSGSAWVGLGRPGSAWVGIDWPCFHKKTNSRLKEIMSTTIDTVK